MKAKLQKKAGMPKPTAQTLPPNKITNPSMSETNYQYVTQPGNALLPNGKLQPPQLSITQLIAIQSFCQAEHKEGDAEWYGGGHWRFLSATLQEQDLDVFVYPDDDGFKYEVFEYAGDDYILREAGYLRSLAHLMRLLQLPGSSSAEKKPVIVCLCGSTQFYEEFQKANFRETISGKIVLSIGCDFKSDDAVGLPPETKERLDELHKRKIDMANEILVLDVDGYIGTSTRSEIEYAIAHGKRVRYLSQENA